jgi:hypothetical protein
MRALLNALGITIWGSIAISLAVALATFGYRASVSYRDSRTADLRPALPATTDINTLAERADSHLPAAASLAPSRSAEPRPTRVAAQSADITRTRFHRAADDQHYAEAEQYGQQLFDMGGATVDDLALIGHFNFLQRNCTNAVLWIDRAIVAARTRGETPKEDVLQIKAQCTSRPANTVPNATTTPNRIKSTAQEISRVIAKEMTAAQRALQSGQWQDALNNLNTAEQKPGLNAFDKKTIYNFKAFADIKLGDLKGAQVEFENALATGAATPDEAASMTRTLFGIAASTSQYQATIAYGEEITEAGAATPNDLAIIAQSYYQLKECRDSIFWSDRAITAARGAGGAPKENLFLFKLQCASDARDTAAMVAVLFDLIKLTNKTTYWNTLLRIERQDEREDKNTLMIYRIMHNTNSMNADTDYIEMAQLLGDAALPGEAAAILNKALSTGVIKDEHKERAARLLSALTARADADRRGLPQQDAEARKSDTGELDVRLGEVYYGFGDYQRAAEAINRGLQKGNIRRLDEAYVYLGLSERQLKNTVDANKTFANLKTVPNLRPQVTKLWELYAATLASAG